MEKIITPKFETIGKRKKLTGYIGELRDGETLIHSMEYSTYSQAEVALAALAFDLLSDMAEQGLTDELPIKPCACGEPATWHVGFTLEPRDEFFCDEHLIPEYIADPIPAFTPSTCVYCHRLHHPQHCPDKNALLFAPDGG